jgi:hypothetical protein
MLVRMVCGCSRGTCHPRPGDPPYLRIALAALDVHPRVAMQILRHSKIAVTMEIYTHIPSDLTRTALHRLGDQLEALG